MPCILYLTVQYLPRPTPAPRPWQFDVTSALIGAAAALLIAGLAYRFRNALRLGWETVLAPLGRLFHRLQAGAGDRYRELVATRARALIVPSHLAPLDDVFVEPRLSAPPLLPESITEVEAMPASLQTLPLRRMLGGHPHLAILGPPGSGRTTLLAYIALACACPTNDGKGEEKGTQVGEALGSIRERLPLYVPLPAMDWNGTNGDGDRASDGTERLVGAAVAAVGGGSGLTRYVRQHVETRQAIVLADGWDELTAQQRQQATAWLSELQDTLPGNVWLVGAGTRGYAPLIEAGFIPITVADWGARQVNAFARQWITACTPDDGEPPAVPRELATELRRALRAGSCPLELALRVFARFSGRQPPPERAALFDQALGLLLGQEEEPGTLAACRAVLGQVALALQQEGHATASREEIEAGIETALPPLEERPPRAAARVLGTLTGERGLLRPAGPNRYVFAHPLWQAYLAARQLLVVDPATLTERLNDPRWAEVLRFYAELGNIGPLVAAWVRGPADMFHTRLHTLSAWVSAAPEGTAWRDGAMAVLARGILQSGQPPRVRQALAEAMAATGVHGTAYFLKQGFQHPDAEVHAAAALGLIRTAGESDIPMLETMLQDNNLAVRAAAVRKLATLDVEAATRWLQHVLLEGDDTLRPLAAEVLALRGEEGVDFLREVAEAEDVMARRAAVFGLAQAEAWDQLEQVARQDEQWIVRSAATAVLEEMAQREKSPGVAPPPRIEQLPWLISWAAAQGEGIGVGDAALQALQRALNAADSPIRLAAAQTLAQVGRPEDVEALRTALDDTDTAVAEAALDALGEISRRYDLRIEPNPARTTSRPPSAAPAL